MAGPRQEHQLSLPKKGPESKRSRTDGNKEKLAHNNRAYGKRRRFRLGQTAAGASTSKGLPSAIEFGTPIYSDGARRPLTPGILSSSTAIYSPFSLLAPYSEPHHQHLIGHSPGVVERALSMKIQTHLASSTKEEEEALIYFYRENGRHKHFLSSIQPHRHPRLFFRLAQSTPLHTYLHIFNRISGPFSCASKQ